MKCLRCIIALLEGLKVVVDPVVTQDGLVGDKDYVLRQILHTQGKYTQVNIDTSVFKNTFLNKKNHQNVETEW